MSGETNKKPISKNRSLFNNTNIKKKVYQERKSIGLNNLNLITKKNINLNRPSNKIINVVDFIKQKKKFFIEDSFDIKGAREFLASKEVAMRVIKLNDEIDIECKNKKEHSITDKNLMNLDPMNFHENMEKKHKSSKIAGKRTISPRKSRKKVKRMNFEDEENKVKSPKKRKEKASDNSSFIGSNGNDANGDKKSKNISNEEDIYKFFIDNASEPDDNFQEKLEKEIRKVESIKKTRKKKVKETDIKRKSQSRKDIKYKRPKRMQSVIVPRSKETQSQFMFSEITKNMMKNDDINISSIGEDEKCCSSPKKGKANKNKVKRAFASIQINNQQLKERILQNIDKKIDDKDDKEFNESENKEGRIEIKSDKESLISILSDLM